MYNRNQLFGGFRWNRKSFGLVTDILYGRHITDLVRSTYTTANLLNRFGNKVLTNGDIDPKKVMKLTKGVPGSNADKYWKKISRGITCKFITEEEMRKKKIIL